MEGNFIKGSTKQKLQKSCTLLVLGLCIVFLGQFLLPHPFYIPSKAAAISWFRTDLEITGGTRDPQTIQQILRAAAQTHIRPIGLYREGITHPEGSGLYYFYVKAEASRYTFQDIEFYIDEVGHLYRNHVIYQYTATGEDLLDLVHEMQERQEDKGTVDIQKEKH